MNEGTKLPLSRRPCMIKNYKNILHSNSMTLKLRGEGIIKLAPWTFQSSKEEEAAGSHPAAAVHVRVSSASSPFAPSSLSSLSFYTFMYSRAIRFVKILINLSNSQYRYIQSISIIHNMHKSRYAFISQTLRTFLTTDWANVVIHLL